jgi:DNA-binding CsgD family transcriptional regulator
MMSEPEALSERELEVLRLVAEGMTNDQIARKLVISTNTVKVHLRNIFAKLGVSSRTEASLYAVREGWVVLDAPTSGPAVAAEEEAPAPETPPAEGPPPRPARPPWTRWLVGVSIVILSLSLVISLTGWPIRILMPTAVPSPSTVAVVGWVERAPMANPRSNLAMVPFQDDLYAIGGDGLQGVSDAVERWDPAANVWTPLASKPTAVADVQAAVVGGHIYVPGGRDAQGNLTKAVEVYLVESNQWTSVAPLLRPLSAYALVAFEGKIYLLGGWDGTQYRDEVLRYSPEDNRWEVVGKLPYPCGFAGAVSTNNRILLVGGINADGPLNVVLEYYPSLTTMLSEPLTDVLGHAQAIVLADDYLFVLADVGEPVDVQLWRHNLDTAPWQVTAPPAAGIPRGAALSGLGAKLYLIGGKAGDTPLAQVLELQAIYFTEPLPAIKP